MSTAPVLMPDACGGRSADLSLIRAALATEASTLSAEGVARADLEGQIIRPLVALAGWRGLSREEPTPAFWSGVLAIQLAHEASLVHDDVVDGSDRRRGEPTLARRRGVAAAVIHGDHLLTTAYRHAVRTGSILFAELFARAVERTVAGEIEQARAAGRTLRIEEYRAITGGKSGELLGCALALAPAILSPSAVPHARDLGVRVGIVYQMLDDLLDLSPSTETGKPPLADHAGGHWTWPFAHLDEGAFGRDAREIVRALHAGPAGDAPIYAALSALRNEAASLCGELAALLGKENGAGRLLDLWVERAAGAVERERAALCANPAKPSRLTALAPTEEGVVPCLARHSRSFHFATRFFPPETASRIARVYAWCRFTDDLVDGPGICPGEGVALLDEWIALSARAYGGKASGMGFLDRVMGEMAAGAVPFRYAAELGEGMRMDVEGRRYPSLEALRLYTYRVASVVGLWISELHGVRDPALLTRAEAMGHAMQLTNILRDVGEDARAGRCYLPADLMLRHGVQESDLLHGRITAGYTALIDEMMAAAEAAYRIGRAGIIELPRELRAPVAVAAGVYGGILREIRRNGYDNLTRRATTSRAAKLELAVRSLTRLAVERARRGEVRLRLSALHPLWTGRRRRAARG